MKSADTSQLSLRNVVANTGPCDQLLGPTDSELQVIGTMRISGAPEDMSKKRHLLPNLVRAGWKLPSEEKLQCVSLWSLEVTSIPRSPKLNRPQHVQLLLQFHREKIYSAHYFAYYDYHGLYTRLLPAMAEDSDALQYAMLAFASLVYSEKVQYHPAHQAAFTYYTMAIKELQPLLNTFIHRARGGAREGELAIATALQLATFDVLHLFPLVGYS
jgi:hypothetical protein